MYIVLNAKRDYHDLRSIQKIWPINRLPSSFTGQGNCRRTTGPYQFGKECLDDRRRLFEGIPRYRPHTRPKARQKEKALNYSRIAYLINCKRNTYVIQFLMEGFS